MAIGGKTLDEEFEVKPLGHFEPYELAEESKIINMLLDKTNNKVNLESIYLNHKKLANYKIVKGSYTVTGVVENKVNDYVKYKNIYQAWKYNK